VPPPYCIAVRWSSRVAVELALFDPALRLPPNDNWESVSAPGLRQRHRVEIGRHDDFQQFAIVGIADHGVLDARRLDPARAGMERMRAFAFELALDPPLEHIDHLEIDVVIMPLGDFFRAERRNKTDDVRLHHAIGCRRDTEVAVLGVRAQALVEIFLAMMAEGETLRLSRLHV